MKVLLFFFVFFLLPLESNAAKLMEAKSCHQAGISQNKSVGNTTSPISQVCDGF